MEPISGLEYVMPTKITILQGRAGKVFFHGAGWVGVCDTALFKKMNILFE